MFGHGGYHKRLYLIFVMGFFFGFIVVRFVSHLKSGNGHATPRRSQQLPQDPLSSGFHGHNEDANGPSEQLIWSDLDDSAHKHEKFSLASELHKKVRILCWVLTAPENHESKARHVKATWGKRCNKLLFMSSTADDQLPSIDLHIPEGRDNLWGKTKAAFAYVYEHHFHEADWFLKADDDTYVIVENLRFLLQNVSADRPVYYGRRFRPYVRNGYMSGGAGYVLSKEALYRFVTNAMPNPYKCNQSPMGAEDVEMGVCLQNVKVTCGDSRDQQQMETFHPFVPEHLLIYGLLPPDMWYWSYNYYPSKEGPECCSDFSISFHYVPPNMMYVFEYFVYHLQPYGLKSKVAIPSTVLSPTPNASHDKKIPSQTFRIGTSHSAHEYAKRAVQPSNEYVQFLSNLHRMLPDGNGVEPIDFKSQTTARVMVPTTFNRPHEKV